jgi:hypothetical protein
MENVSDATPKARAPRSALPPPPPPNAALLTLNEAAGYLRTRRRTIDDLRRNDAAFAAMVLIVGGSPRIRRAALEMWLDSRPTGWSNMGGRRAGAFVSRPR